MATLLERISHKADLIIIMGKSAVDLSAENTLSLVDKYIDYVTTNSLEDTYLDSLNKLKFQLDNSCC